jgi:predicted DNA-binding transcriptional regulator AlpA
MLGRSDMVERVTTTTEVRTVEHILNTAEVSGVTRAPVPTLRWWRHKGIGPRWFRVGPRKVFYKESDVLAWMEEQYNAEQVDSVSSRSPVAKVAAIRRADSRGGDDRAD